MLLLDLQSGGDDAVCITEGTEEGGRASVRRDGAEGKQENQRLAKKVAELLKRAKVEAYGGAEDGVGCRGDKMSEGSRDWGEGDWGGMRGSIP